MADAPDPDLYVKLNAFTNTTHRDAYPAIDPARPELSQAGKVVVITGASRGLGQQGLAASLARANAKGIALLGRSADGLAETEKLVKEINPATHVLSIPVDVLDEAGVSRAFDEIVSQLGIPNVLVNNAGALSLGTIAESDVESWWKLQEVNIKGTFLVTKAFLSKVGSSPSSPTTIISLTSMSAMGLSPDLSSYSITKLAINKFTAWLNFEHPAITSVSLDPGVVETDMATSIWYLEPFMKDTPQLTGGTAVWLASGDKQFLSGRTISANWDMEELEAKKQEIVEGDLLTLCFRGSFGSRQTPTLEL
ncbi:SDR family NAD(P)-dependent oxidoreductase [Aspergillus undulatus]|uniref:SDR family NAD(P)-dependent oxidoreductase n=1 Tax=Aspergillus undulatus TaxID=1810928 RepID=UPI003CCD79CE